MNRRDFIKSLPGIALLPLLPFLKPKLRTFGGWVKAGDTWGFRHVTGYRCPPSLFDGKLVAMTFVSEPLSDEAIEALYQQTKQFFT